MNANNFVKDLYASVDNKDVEGLASKLNESVYFKFSNHEAVNGLSNVLEANKGFFASINSMSHTLTGVWQQGDELICNGQVRYVRHDGSHYSAEFATILTVMEDKITHYLIYADVSGL